jgi:hypothetical protein
VFSANRSSNISARRDYDRMISLQLLIQKIDHCAARSIRSSFFKSSENGALVARMYGIQYMLLNFNPLSQHSWKCFRRRNLPFWKDPSSNSIAKPNNSCCTRLRRVLGLTQVNHEDHIRSADSVSERFHCWMLTHNMPGCLTMHLLTLSIHGPPKCKSHLSGWISKASLHLMSSRIAVFAQTPITMAVSDFLTSQAGP